jgi:uncharacterized OB-fold protein
MPDPAPGDYRKPLPRLDDGNRPFWEGARRGELCVQRCVDCGTLRFPAARHCARCLGDRSDWTRLSGRGTVESFCVFHQPYVAGFEAELPYNVVLVRLDEGPMLFSNLVDIANDQIRIGMAVTAWFEPVTAERGLVKFRAAE